MRPIRLGATDVKMPARTRPRIRSKLLAALVVFLASALALAGMARAGTAPKTELVSVSLTGGPATRWSEAPSISADGRFVTFDSGSRNLVEGDMNHAPDAFVRDRKRDKTSRVSVSSAGAEGNGSSRSAAISADGRFVAFRSFASNLVAGDTNATADVFVRNRETGKTRRVSVSSAGTEANDGSFFPSISADGRFVAFFSDASNLVVGDTNGQLDVFVRDRRRDKTRRVSVSSAGAEANGGSTEPSISADGRFVAFPSDASNLVVGDTNGQLDVFVRDRRRDKTTRVSVTSAGAEANDGSFNPSISADGRFVAFPSYASNLVEGDTNQTGDTFVRDRRRDKTTRVSVSSAGAEANGGSASISADGRFVAFPSDASNVVGGDTNDTVDVFVRDRRRDKTTRVSVSSAGAESNGFSFGPSISADGRFVAFVSGASNLGEVETNAWADVFVRGPLRSR
jgi:Tol biopolymer transport system component